jgi:glycosyltransferase 2 family protein
MITEADIKFPDIPFGKTAVLVIVGLALYLGYLYFVGFDSVKEVLLHANYWFLGLAILMSLVGNLFHAAGWWALLKGMKYKISLFNSYLIYLSSTFFVNIIPSAAISGEIAKIYFIQKSTPGARFDRTLAPGLMSRILEIIPTATGVIIGVVYLALYYNVPQWALVFCFFIAGAVALIALGALGVFLNNPLLRRMAASGFRVLGRVFKKHDFAPMAENVDQVLKQFDDSLRSITKRPMLIGAALLLIFVAWCFDMSVAYIAFLAVGYQVSALFVVTIFSVMVILQLLPTFLPGGLGLIDILMTTLYLAMGVPREAAAGATIMVRLVTLWFLTTLGGVITVYLMKAHDKTAENAPKEA